MKNTYNIITIGCQMNKADSERVAGFLDRHGYVAVGEAMLSDVVVVTTCGIRQSAEDRIYGIIPRIKKKNPECKLVLTGCLSQREDVRRRLAEYVDYWMPISELPNMADILAIGVMQAKPVGPCEYLAIDPKHQSNFNAFVPIGNGCNNFCAYCVVPYARGREVYRPAEEVVAEVENLVAKGYKEITLIAQNVNSYRSPGEDQEVDFPSLLRRVNDVAGQFWIRFSTSHPKDMSEELIKAVAECHKACEYIHLPAQSGDDGILAAMNRKYSSYYYKGLIRMIRSYLPDVGITTDIIVGFPSETKDQFEHTAQLFKEVKYDMAYISQYSPRPGTAAARLKDDVPKAEKKKREEFLMGILRETALENNKKHIGKNVEVLIDGYKKGSLVGKTRTSKTVMVGVSQGIDTSDFVGKFIEAKVVKARDFGLEAIYIRKL